jgi:hypothetical protein
VPPKEAPETTGREAATEEGILGGGQGKGEERRLEEGAY